MTFILDAPWVTEGAIHSTKNSGNSGLGSEWNRHFPEFHSEMLGVPREVGLKFRKIGITGKFRSIRPFLLGPSFSEPGNRNSTWLIFKLLNIILVLYQTNDWNILLQRYGSGLASQTLVSSAKIQSYVKCEHNRSSEQLARHSKVTLELVRKIERHRNVVEVPFLNSYDKSDILSLSPNISFISTSESSSNPKASKQR